MKQLIKEVDINGIVWYHTKYNGIKVTPYTHNYEEAVLHFKDFKPITPTSEVILEEKI